MDQLDVAVIGCGFAGAAAAAFLARQGNRVTIYERFDAPEAIGAGIILQPTGMTVLDDLGLLAGAVERGSRLDGLYCRNARGRTLMDLHYGALADGVYGLGMHRGALFELLFAAARREGATVRTGTPIEDLATAPDGRRLVVTPDGTRHGPHDLVVVADGARSQLRDDATIDRSVTPYPWGALWFVGEDMEGVFRRRLHQVADGTRRLVGFLPTGFGPRARRFGSPLVTLFWSIRLDEMTAWRSGDLRQWKDQILRLEPRAEGLLEQILDHEQVLSSSYLDVVMDGWNTCDVVYVGDAGHAMSPQLGQGCNMALVDAQVLARCIAAERQHVNRALDEYTRQRRDNLAFYQFASRWLTPLFQSDHSWLAPLRDACLGPMAWLPLVGFEMLRTVVGTKTGPLTALPLEQVTAALPPASRVPPSLPMSQLSPLSR